MYNDLLFERLAGLPEIDRDERIQALIDEVEALDNLLSPEAQDLSRDLRPRTVTDDVYDELEENATFGDRLADRLAEWAGSWRFIISFSFFMLAWMGINAAQGENAFDPFPFILLNLTLSTLAALQAPVILMSQNRQAKKDRAVAENDYHVNLKNELEIADLHRKIDVLMSTVEVQNRMVNALVNARKRELDATMRVIERDYITHETR
ncbi:MAG: cyclic nucleotide-binding protein [Phototrophicales bacterium]|nr:MAG: cyclic nucleotide-binding protein [Phototrophicales bacterium]